MTDDTRESDSLPPTVSGPGEGASGADDGRAPSVEGYDVTGRLGRGGMGTVWRAVQLATHREVALKLLSAGDFATEKARRRFEREVELASNLEHPNIARVYDSGLHHHVYYYAMEWVQGRPLDRYVADEKLSPREIIALMRTVAEAVQYAHQRGVIHRDLKPSNILVTADRQPHVLDFGLAKTLREDAADVTVSVDGEIAGTPAYMSPEQAAGRRDEIDTRSDVYSLGVILYELLTGESPHDLSGTRYEVLRRIAEEEVKRPRDVSRVVDREVEALLLKALAHNREDRYGSAGELAQDLVNYLSGDPLSARRPTTWYFLRKRLWKHRRTVAATLVLVAVAAAAGVGVVHYARVATHTRKITELKRDLDRKLDATGWSAESLEEMEAVAQELARFSEADGATAQRLIYQRLTAVIEAWLRRPSLDDAEVARIENTIALLERRRADAASLLRQALVERLRVWEPIFELEAPFGNLDEVFDTEAVRAGREAMVRGKIDRNDKTSLLLTRVPCRGEVQLEAVFAEEWWEKATRLGLVLNGGEERGYEFILMTHTQRVEDPIRGVRYYVPTFGEVRHAHGPVRVRIRRHGATIRETDIRSTDVTAGPLRLVARREGDELTFQVNELSPVVCREVFPVSRAEHGVFGLCWDRPAVLTLLRATGLARSVAPSPLEEGDTLYADGRFAEALAHYRRQAVSATEATFRQEARYKEGLCLVGLKRTDEAKEVFRVLSQEPGDRWVIAATCQLWLLELQDGRLKEADNLFVCLTASCPYAKLAQLMPYDVVRRIIAAYFVRSSGTALLQFDPACVGYLEKVMTLQDLLEDSPYERFTTRLMLARASDLAGQRDRAIRVASELIRGGDDWDYMMNTQAVWFYTWMMSDSGRHREALDEIERLIREKPSWGDRYVAQLYIDRACLQARLGAWDDAERDLDEYFRRRGAPSSYLDDTRAYLMQGFVRERRGDTAGALESWRAGRALGLPGGRKGSPFTSYYIPAYGQDYLQFVMIASLAERLSEEDVKRVLSETLFSRTGEAVAPVLLDRLAPTAAPVACEMWRTPRGREYARRIVFREGPMVDLVRLPAVLFGTEYVKRYAFGGKVSEEQEEWMVKFAHDGFDEVWRGRLGRMSQVCLLFAWEGTTGFLGWDGVKGRLAPALRGPVAYVLGHRYLRLGRPDDAMTFFTTAAGDAPAGSALRRLAEDALKQLAPKTVTPGAEQAD